VTGPTPLPSARPPSVDRLARSLRGTGLPHPLLVDAARDAIAAGDPASAPARADALRRALLGPVVNATGVLLHTNLGRAPLGIQLPAVATNLELDLATGARGSRQSHAGALLARACGAEAGLVVNNGAAAVLLALAALARDRAVAVSRGELVEIGGGFRIPEVLAESGARLVEVGTTNRTRLDDYRAVAGEVAYLLKVHTSNYRTIGFTASVDVPELATVGPPVLLDAGSGLLDARCPWLPGAPPAWLRDEPGVRQALEGGAALVCFSGDKLLGGPQAGILVGRADLVAACARHPLYRATRPGALVLAALQEVALAYLDGTAAQLPFWQMAAAPAEELAARAAALGVGEVVATEATTGGGSMPGLGIPSAGVALPGDRRAALRSGGETPVIARVEGGRTILDLRTVAPGDDELVAGAARRAVSQEG
jgi:L-seryl-tRNA(Ser) seleniumtransferase